MNCKHTFNNSMAADDHQSSSPALPLAGRVAIVTGGSRGIGRAVATHLSSLGASLVINYSSRSTQADNLVSDLNAMQGQPRAMAVQADVSSPEQVDRLFDLAEEELGPVSILVNCAGVMSHDFPALSDTSVEEWDDTFSVNTRGAFLCSRAAARRLRRGGGGRIILVTTSVVAALTPGYAAYAASKAAVETMGRILAKEMKGTGITVNCVAPGPVATDLFFAGKTEEMIGRIVGACPMGRLGQPEDISRVIGFLAVDAGEWINGQVIRVNGGFV